MLGLFVLLAAGAAAGAAAAEVFRARRLVARLHAVALCTHELRGSLTAIDAALSRHERSSLGSDRSQLASVRHAYDRAVAVVHDLEAARGARRAAALQRPEAVDVREVAQRIVEAWNAWPPGGPGRVSLDWDAGRVLVLGYRLRLAQAFDNLVANAIEHGRGPVTVIGRRTGDTVSVCVLDRGAGLMRPLDDVRARSWQAARGHGLVVARHAVELHGGTLRPVRGPLGAGIEVRLPSSAEPAPVRAVGPRPAPRRSGSGTAG